MTNAELIQKIRNEIERRKKELEEQIVDVWDSKAAIRKDELQKLLSFLSTLEEEPEEESDLQDAEVIFSGYALHTDVTKWADGYKLRIRIYDDN